MGEQNPLIGKTITAIHLASDNKAMRFDVVEGEPIVARCDGDCCSDTWIEHVEGAADLVGEVVTVVENINMPQQPEEANYDIIAFYGCKIRSERTEMLVDYRNLSNGYYGGNLSWPNDNYFYGGVYGQNVSTEYWQRIA